MTTCRWCGKIIKIADPEFYKMCLKCSDQKRKNSEKICTNRTEKKKEK